MRLLLIGEIFSNNLGDQLVYETAQYQLEQIYPNATFSILDIMGRTAPIDQHTLNKPTNRSVKEQVRYFLGKSSLLNNVLSKRSASKLCKYYDSVISQGKYDLAVFTGGQLISDIFVEYIYTICNLFSKHKIPFVFNAVGLGVISRISIKRYKAVFSFPEMKAITCRSNGDTFNHLFFSGNNAVETFDTAITVSEQYVRSKVPANTVVGLGVMSTTRIPHNRLIDFWTEIICQLEKDNINWRMFTTGCFSDYELAREILNCMHITDNQIEEKLLGNPKSTRELAENIQSFSFILSFRLHSHIIAYSYGIPSSAIVWDNKLNDFFTKVGRENHLFGIDSSVDSIVENIYENIKNTDTMNTQDELNDIFQTVRNNIYRITSL